MQKKRIVIIIASLTVGILIISGALFISYKRNQQAKLAQAPIAITEHAVSKSELAAADGKNGRTCLVAVDGTVYKIEDFSLWQNGEHTTSNGLAYCGADLTSVLDQSPHGRSILKLLIKVGPLGN